MTRAVTLCQYLFIALAVDASLKVLAFFCLCYLGLLVAFIILMNFCFMEYKNSCLHFVFVCRVSSLKPEIT